METEVEGIDWEAEEEASDRYLDALMAVVDAARVLVVIPNGGRHYQERRAATDALEAALRECEARQ